MIHPDLDFDGIRYVDFAHRWNEGVDHPRNDLQVLPPWIIEPLKLGFVIAKENQVFGLHEADIDAAWADILDSKEGRCAEGVKPIVFARRIDAMNMLHALEWLHKSELENVVVVLPWPFNPGCR